jgi:hypothetical protein
MSIEKGINTYLETNVDLLDSRCYLLRLPQGVTLPALRFFRITSPRLTTHDEDNTGLVMSNWQLDLYADSFDDIVNVSEQLHEVLDGYRGLMGTESVGMVLPTGERDFERPEIGAYRREFDYAISYKE